jgi:hypothetical protein
VDDACFLKHYESMGTSLGSCGDSLTTFGLVSDGYGKTQISVNWISLFSTFISWSSLKDATFFF